MNNKIFQINKIFLAGIFTFLVFSVPFFAMAESQLVEPVAVTGIYKVYSEVDNTTTVRVLGRASTGKDINAQVWFECGTSETSLSRCTDVQTVFLHGGVEGYMLNITQDTKYYYRVVVRNSSFTSQGKTLPLLVSSGNEVEAPEIPTTPSSEPYNPPVPTYNNPHTSVLIITPPTTTEITYPMAITNAPKNVMITRADLSGSALPGGNITTDGWFEWGETTALGSQTPRKNIGNNTPINFTETLIGFSPNTTYYYRAVVQNQKGIDRGDIVQFKTKQTPQTQTHPNKNTTGTTTPTNKIDEQKEGEDQLAAVASAGSGFIPDTLIEWFILIILLLIVIILSYYLYGVHKKRKEEEWEQLNVPTENDVPFPLAVKNNEDDTEKQD